MKIYLSGGMRGDWQDKVIAALPQFDYFDPRQKALTLPSQYTTWDLFYVRRSDIIFAFMEENNPSGIGLALECGYAKALNKLVILVDEKKDRYFAIVREAVDLVFDSLEQGIGFLRELNV